MYFFNNVSTKCDPINPSDPVTKFFSYNLFFIYTFVLNFVNNVTFLKYFKFMSRNNHCFTPFKFINIIYKISSVS